MTTNPVIETINPSELPIPPEGAFRIIHACNKENSDAHQLGRLLERDPVLTIEILRIANSAYFGFSGKITTVSRAVAVIGQRTLRHIVLCVAMRDALKPGQLPALSVETFWTNALRRAVCARALATETGLDVDTSFTVGLLQDFGLLVLFYLNPHRIAEWPGLAELAPDDRYAMERQLFDTTHDQVGQQLAESWNLPQELSLAMGFHHRHPTYEIEESSATYCHIAQCADWMSAVFSCTDKRHSLGNCHALLEKHFDLPRSETDRLLSQTNEQLTEAAQAFGFDIGEQVSYAAVIRQANMRLLEENQNIQEMNWQLENVLKERDRVAAELKQELDLAREVQRSLLPMDNADQLKVFGINLSAKAVSGDFYDFLKLHNGKVAFCIADVSGKGMHAALLMAKTSSLFHCLGKSLHDPAKLLTMINREIVETSIHGMFITMAAGVIDPETSEVMLCNAGHLPVLRMRQSQPVGEYPALSPPLGIMPETMFRNETFNLKEDSLYLYTDGLLEAKVTAQERQGKERLLTLFGKYANKQPVERLQFIVADLRQQSEEIEDDMTLLLIEGTM
ncbi:MAG: HDOD domain-containing protein [Candidatus Thiodiazotropha sp. (ex Monitilora ramsayi)]|nr:HDOD domain-containing protein [Candidatus Thiodiazotropha sp. (ex Monitilora ramsayi)]